VTSTWLGRQPASWLPSTGDDRLDVHDGRAVEGFEVAHEHAQPVDRGDLDPVQSVGVTSAAQ
jgi:hypothetical protein